MKISTIYPVIYNRKQISSGNFFMSHLSDGFVNFDSSSSSETSKFQTWFNSNRKSSDPANLVVDGIYGPLTTAAYNSPTGQMYDATITGASTTNPQVLKQAISKATTPNEAGGGKPATDIKLGGSPATPETKAAGMSKNTKIAIAAGGAGLLLLIIILANRKNRAGSTTVKNIFKHK